MTKASEADYELIRELRKRDILKDLVGDRIPAEKGTIVMPCADGDRITDILINHWRQCNGRQCHHNLSLNGGPLLIPEGSPVAQFGERGVLLEHAHGGYRLKEISTVVLYGHWPCGAAIMAHLSLYGALEYCIRAKDDIRAFFRRRGTEIDAVLCFHVDYADGRKKSYYFDRQAWRAWNEERYEEY